MTDREKLIALMHECCNARDPCPVMDCFECIVDRLIANGVVVTTPQSDCDNCIFGMAGSDSL